MNVNPLNDAAATIVNGAGAGISGLIDLGGADRAWQVANGAAAVDLTIDVPITNGALTKDGAGTLALSGANSYTGDTSVEEGTLSVSSSFLSDAADLYLSTGAILDLSFNGGPDVIDSLFFDGVSQAAGTWGAVGSGAQFTSPLISGTGMLEVSTFIAPIPGDFDADGDVDGRRPRPVASRLRIESRFRRRQRRRLRWHGFSRLAAELHRRFLPRGNKCRAGAELAGFAVREYRAARIGRLSKSRLTRLSKLTHSARKPPRKSPGRDDSAIFSQVDLAATDGADRCKPSQDG